MFKLAALALIGSAAAFAPAQQGASSTQLASAFENEVSLPRLRLLLVERFRDGTRKKIESSSFDRHG